MKPKLLYIYPSRSAFVKEDIDFLRSAYDVVENPLLWTSQAVPFSLLKQLFFLLYTIRKVSAVIVMFGGYWSILPLFMAKLYNKPSFLILGGTDCVSYPEFNYGSIRKRGLRFCIRKSVQYAHYLLPVDDSLIYTQNTYYSTQKLEQGIRHFFPDITTTHQTIYNGFDTHFWENETPKVPNSFISVALIDNTMRYVLKGFDLILAAAPKFPQCTFTLIGINEVFAANLQVPANVKIFPKTKQEDFKKHLAESEFYLQLSISEGFPNGICEGMASGCIPIGSNVNAIPHIIGDTGFLLEQRSQLEFEKLLHKVLELQSEEKKQLAYEAKQRIKNNFPMTKRKQAFLEILSKSKDEFKNRR